MSDARRAKMLDVAGDDRRAMGQGSSGNHQVPAVMAKIGGQPSPDPRILCAKRQDAVREKGHRPVGPDLQIGCKCRTTNTSIRDLCERFIPTFQIVPRFSPTRLQLFLPRSIPIVATLITRFLPVLGRLLRRDAIYRGRGGPFHKESPARAPGKIAPRS
jgi:hypothetical protein